MCAVHIINGEHKFATNSVFGQQKQGSICSSIIHIINYVIIVSFISFSDYLPVYGQENKGKSGKATLKDSMAVYNNAQAVLDFYEHSGQYVKTHETRINTDDPAKIHATNDKKYASVIATIDNERLTPQGKRRIKPEEYRIVIDKYTYKQRELSDYVLNTDAPMQLFDRRIAPQILVDYMFTGNPTSPINNDDVDFKMYDPIAVKPYSKLTPTEKVLRDKLYPQKLNAGSKKKAMETANKPEENGVTNSSFIISGALPDSLRFKRFKTRKEAETFIKALDNK